MRTTKRMLAFVLAAALTVTGMPSAAKAETGTKPEDGATIWQPFSPGTGGSENFRIPGLVSLDDGTLVAACDARWNHAGDACGLDTIVSRSTDNGLSWNYTFANYLGDNGNKYHANSTAFIDPAIATDGETVYMIADLFPGGYALNTAPNSPVAGENGLDQEGRLRLSNDNRATYQYHLEKAEAGDGFVIVNNDGDKVDGYTVDAYFNLTGNNTNSNLFYSDSPYLVYPTDYLYLTSSTDGGATWSTPSLLNLKKEAEQTLLVGPGRGIVTSTNRIVFTAYEFTSGDRNSVCIYSDDQGKTWKRGQSVSSLSSEATVVEADGKLYMFTRHGGYYVSSDWGETWTNRITPSISYCQTCQLSAITYSKKIDGKTAIILSAPSATNRAAGKLFIGLVQDDGSLSWDYSYSVNKDAYYAYSCLTELNDGSIGLLYENDGAAITYTNIPIETAAAGAAIGNIWCTDMANQPVASIKMNSNSAVTHTVHSADNSADIKVSCSGSLIKASLSGSALTITSSSLASDIAMETISLTGKAATVSLNVYVTDSENYEIVNLRMGDSFTVQDYQNESVTNSNPAVAQVTKGSDALDIQAMKEGKASVKVGDRDYFIFVKNDEANLKLEVGDSITIPGNPILKDADSKIVTIDKKPFPYKTITDITEDGQYLIGNGTHIVISADSQKTNPSGRAMKTANFAAEDLVEDAWTITAVADGYTIKNTDGQYLAFDGSNVALSSEPQTMVIAKKTGGFSISHNGMYLNNYAGSNDRAAGYGVDDQTWRIYQETGGAQTVTGISEGRTSFVLNGTTYHITVGDPLPADVQQALNALQATLDSANTLLATDLSGYTDASISNLKNACTAAQSILNAPKAQTVTTITNADNTLKQAMQLEKKIPADVQQALNALQATLNSANALLAKDLSGYTDASISNLKNACTAAQNILNAPKEQTAATVTNADNTLKQAMQLEAKKEEKPTTPDLPAVGKTFSTKSAVFKILTSTQSGGTVSYVKPKKSSSKTVKIPASVKIKGLTYKVTEIGNSAFKGNKKITQVTISSNVQKIGKSAFEGCKNLKKIGISSANLKSVDKNAIKGVHKKCVIRVPSKKVSAYKNLFKNKGFKSSMKIRKK